MARGTSAEESLFPYRVLDLTDEHGQMCGKMLGDMGGDVIIVEPPGGSSARGIGPFFRDDPHPEGSLFWLAFNTSKRSITLDVVHPDGRELFLRLVETADAVVTTLHPRRLSELGLSYQELARRKPDIVLTTITPFGPDGPYGEYVGSDLVLQALSGFLYLSGDPDRPPTRVSVPMVATKTGAEAAAATAMALYHRGLTGEGQQVDVSALAVAQWQLMNAAPFPRLHGTEVRRGGGYFTALGTVKVRAIYPCKDGYVYFFFLGGTPGATSMTALTRWLDEEGTAPRLMLEKDWAGMDMGKYMYDPEAQKEVEVMETSLARFFLGKTKQQLFDRAYRERILIAPVNDVRDMVEHPQPNARGFFVEVDHPELAASFRYPGHLALLSEGRVGVRRRAPRIGEHNREVYVEELGISRERLAELSEAGVIGEAGT